MSMNPHDNFESGPKGMSGTTKVLIGLGIGCGVVVVLCCGVVGLGGYWFTKAMESAVSKDPATVQRVTGEIVTIDVPQSFRPEASIDTQFPFGQGSMQMAVYSDPAAKATLMLMQFSGETLANDPNFRGNFEKSMDQQFKKQVVQAEKSEKTDVTINGEPATFTIVEGTGSRSAGQVMQVTGSFRGKTGVAQFVLEAESPDFTREQALEIVKSMK
jgi:hypothetical protein